MNTVHSNFKQVDGLYNKKHKQSNHVLPFRGKDAQDQLDLSTKQKEGNVFIVSGPSGTGKGTILNEILKKISNISLSVSATTRSPRPKEVNGIHYYFIKPETFKNLIDKNKFIEWEEVYKDQYYGTLKDPITRATKSGKDIILEITANTHDFIKKQIPKAISIFIAPPSFEELTKRLVNRKTESKQKIDERLDRAKKELKYQDRFDHVVVNNDLDKAIQEVTDIILESRKQPEAAGKDLSISA